MFSIAQKGQERKWIFKVLAGQILGTILYVLLIPLYFYKHLENLRRIAAGTEARLSYLWSKDENIRRMREEARQR